MGVIARFAMGSSVESARRRCHYAPKLLRMAQVDRKLTGSADEHFVCSALAQLGWAASLTREGVARADILAVHASSARRLIEVQVKTISTSGTRAGPWAQSGSPQ